MEKKPEHHDRARAGPHEQALDHRQTRITAREAAADRRDRELTEREELVQLRARALDARKEADAARVAQQHLLVQMQEANEKLVLATMRAEALADEATAARLTAADSEERFRLLVTTAAAIVWQASPEGSIQFDPESWSAFTGMTAEQTSGAWLEAVHPEDRQRVRDAWAHAIATTTAYSCQHRLRKLAGDYAWVVARAVPILRRGLVREWIGMISDVTDRVRIEEARETFIGILGHDLRAPLASIAMGAEVLGQAAALPAEQHATIVAQIARSAERMAAMIRDLMDFALGRLGGGIPITPVPCDVGQICAEVVAELRQAHPTRAIHGEMIGDLRGACDAGRIAQALTNLVANAITHGEDPIRVTARDEGHELVVYVHNQGAPIPPAVFSTMFEPFVRESRHAPGAQARRDGLGLGLYIASEIVRSHRGTIAVASDHGQGTTFTLRWPRIASARG